MIGVSVGIEMALAGYSSSLSKFRFPGYKTLHISPEAGRQQVYPWRRKYSCYLRNPFPPVTA